MAALNVLVVEDDAMIGILLTEMLEDMGYVVCAVSATEDEAVAAAARYHPGLMIVDENLREGTGSSAMDRVLLTGPMPCVFTSGVVKLVARPNASALQKPFLEADLVRAIQQVIGPGAPEPSRAAAAH